MILERFIAKIWLTSNDFEGRLEVLYYANINIWERCVGWRWLTIDIPACEKGPRSIRRETNDENRLRWIVFHYFTCVYITDENLKYNQSDQIIPEVCFHFSSFVWVETLLHIIQCVITFFFFFWCGGYPQWVQGCIKLCQPPGKKGGGNISCD